MSWKKHWNKSENDTSIITMSQISDNVGNEEYTQKLAPKY